MSARFSGVDHTINQGATFQRSMRWRARNEDGTVGDPVDLTGLTARAQLREDIEDAGVLLELTTTNGRITLGGEEGTIDLSLSAVETAALDFPRAVYDLELVYPDGRVERLMDGVFTVSPEITRA